MAKLAFAIVLLHWIAIGYGWMQPRASNGTYNPLFYETFLQVSPIMVIFNLMAMVGADYNGRFSQMVWIGLGLALVKYGSMIIAIKRDGLNFLMMVTLAMEAIYLAASGVYLAQLNIL